MAESRTLLSVRRRSSEYWHRAATLPANEPIGEAMKPIEVATQADDLLGQPVDADTAPMVRPASSVSSIAMPVRRSPTDSPTQNMRLPERPRRAAPVLVVHNVYELVGTTVGLVFSLTIGLGLWIAGAWCTLQFLADLGLGLATWGYWQWLVPLGISGAELFLWPRSRRRVMPGLMFLAVLAFDVGTTYAGFVAIAGGRVLPIFAGIHLPSSGPGLAVLGVAAGLLCAFGPERIARWVVGDLYVLWSGRLWT